jgi:transcriptional regulator with XRE-family HTH domain
MNDYAFGNFLFTLRTEKGLSQAQLGELLGVTNKAVSKWENGSAKPNTSLIPQLSKVLGVTVEELFACKKIGDNSELEQTKQYLFSLKRRYAIFTSVFLSLLVSIPFLLIEFICVVMGFGIPDDVIGPLGAMLFILSFIVSLTAFIIYRKNFKQTLFFEKTDYDDKFSDIIKKWILRLSISWVFVLGVTIFIYFLIISISSNLNLANVFLLCGAFVWILLSASLICFGNIKRLLKIKFWGSTQKTKKRIRFRELPLWAKISCVATWVLIPVVLNLQILSLFNLDLHVISYVATLLLVLVASPVIIYNFKNK